jgi:hypothetical protein
MLKFPKLVVNHVKALAVPTQANCLSEQTRVILFNSLTSVYIYMQRLFEFANFNRFLIMPDIRNPNV